MCRILIIYSICVVSAQCGSRVCSRIPFISFTRIAGGLGGPEIVMWQQSIVIVRPGINLDFSVFGRCLPLFISIIGLIYMLSETIGTNDRRQTRIALLT